MAAHDSGDLSEDVSPRSDPALAALLLLESSGHGSESPVGLLGGSGSRGLAFGVDRSASSSSVLEEDAAAAVASLESSHNGDISLNAATLERRTLKLHPPANAPLCTTCEQRDVVFFDPYCRMCRARLHDPATTPSQLFAIMRQWVPQVQCNILMLTKELLKRGVGVDDVDVVSGCTPLHFAARAGSPTVGDAAAAREATALLLSRGANYYVRALWTSMMPIHYAAFFDVPAVLVALFEHKTDIGLNIDFECTDYDNGTALHLACTNMSYEAAKLLLEKGASLTARDASGRMPYDVIPDEDLEEPDSLHSRRVRQMHKLLSTFEAMASANAPCPNYDTIHSKVTLNATGLKLGDHVLANGKAGTLRFCGAINFSAGVWAGVELDTVEGKSDGSIGGIAYFNCPSGRGTFVPMSKVTKAVQNAPKKKLSNSRQNSLDIGKGKLDVSHITAKTDTGLNRPTLSRSNSFSQEASADVGLGDRVTVAGYRGRGIVRYVGKLKNCSGHWYGVELDHPVGKNDGSVDGERYFVCKPQRGIFCAAVKIKRVLGSRAVSNESLNSLNSNHNLSWTGREKRLSAGGSQSSLDSVASSGGQSVASASSNASGSHRVRSLGSSGIGRTAASSGHSSSTKRSPGGPSRVNVTMAPATGAPAPPRLEQGCSVLYAGELAIVRYIGPVDFADGVWMGIELRSGKGKHDGKVQGRRYFTCKPMYGLLVKPSRITMKGVNGAKLITERPPVLSELPKLDAAIAMMYSTLSSDGWYNT